MKSTQSKVILVSLCLLLSAGFASSQILFTERTIDLDFRGARAIFAHDIDGDGDMDILAAAEDDDDVTWWENDGEENFSEHVIDNNLNGAYDVYAIDLDSDGDSDVLAAGYQANDIVWYENDGNENFTEHTIDATFDGASSVFAIDMDDDDDIDILATAYTHDDITWWENDGNENFTEHTIKGNFDGASDCYAIDVDSDGDIDVLGTAYRHDDITWWENDGNENFSEHVIRGNYDGAISVYAADMDGDNDIDVFGCAEKADDVTWWENDGNENFSIHTIAGSFDGANCIYADDVDSDGDMDIMASGQNFWWIFTLNSTMRIWQNDGNENFTGVTVRTNYYGASSIFCADLDGDTYKDVLGTATHVWLGYWRFDRVTWWENLAITDEGVGLSMPRDEYILAGIPVEVNDGDAAELFRDDFDDTDPGPTTWRISQWDHINNRYVRYGEENDPPGDPDDFAPGLGFFVVQDVVDDAVLFIDVDQFDDDGYLPEDQRHRVPINAPVGANRGLKLLSNPFNYTYDWRTTQVDDGTEVQSIADAAADGWLNGRVGVWDYINQEYTNVDFVDGQPNTLDPWCGFWIEQIDETRTLDILFTPESMEAALNNSSGIELDEGENWYLQLPVVSADAQYRDAYNMIGINELSNDEYDLLDAMDYIPQSSEYVRLFFDHWDWDVLAEYFSYDVRSLEFDGPKTWEFTIRILNLPNTDFDLYWPNISEVSLEYDIVLENSDTGEHLVNLRSDSLYSFNSGDSDQVELNYQLVVTFTPDVVNNDLKTLPGRYSISQAYPNPFNPTTTLTLSLPEASYAHIEVFNLVGQSVKVLSDKPMSAGQHKIVFDGSDLASGVYFIKAYVPDKINDFRKVVLIK